MKKLWILLLIGCTSTRIPSPAPTITIYTPLEVTIMLNQQAKQIEELKKSQVTLDTSQWVLSGTTVKFIKTDSFTVLDYLMVGRKKDTTRNPHEGNDTLIHAPN